ncbi:nitroreductase [candidate division KSB3 bacterium]|uniref:Nitroreductase n=1 Tax=candidate division KSB3 bacterium TaxID=2044937 RepID=A0A2G6KDU3_9BACT|nr:MAG: nitroreductase [candidate division KSB3 bacterium]
MIKDLISRNRSYRRFDESFVVSTETLRELVDLGRLSPSGANRQPLKYILSNDPENNARIFPALNWAGYLSDWDGPPEGEQPSAYIILLGDNDISQSTGCDHGIAAQSILLGAVEKELGGCMIASIQKGKLREALNLSERYDIVLVIALGKPVETVVIDPIATDGDIKYWRDEQATHHVPKRSLDEIIIE